MHYISNKQMVTLATSNDYTMGDDGATFSQEKFCIPFLGTDSTYLVAEERGELNNNERCNSVIDKTVKYIKDARIKIRETLSEFETLENEVVQIQNKLRKKMELGNGDSKDAVNSSNVNGLLIVNETVLPNHEASVLIHKESSKTECVLADAGVKDLIDVHGEAVADAVSDEKYVDYYGFSDTDEDNSEDGQQDEFRDETRKDL